ncbi:MAG: hypothetical protein ACK5NY_00095 [Burkholderiaceae bacterium]|jgi:hypothetical protein
MKCVVFFGRALVRLCGWSLLLLLTACGSPPLKSSRAEGWTQRPAAGVLFVTPEFRMYEVPLGGKEQRVVAWEKQASGYFRTAIEQSGALPAGWTRQAAETLDDTQQKLVEQHYGLFCTLAPQLLLVKSDRVPALAEKRENFTYTLGPGLAPLIEATGAQLMVFALGQDRIRSVQRRVFDSAMSLNVMTMGRKAQTGTMALAVVELATGDILWFDNEFSTRRSFNDAEDVADLTNILLGRFLAAKASTL